MTPQEIVLRYLELGGTRHRLQLASGYAGDTVKRVADGRRVGEQAMRDIVEAACRIKPSIRRPFGFQELPDHDDSAEFFAASPFPFLHVGLYHG
jgi:hypothetical protein